MSAIPKLVLLPLLVAVCPPAAAAAAGAAAPQDQEKPKPQQGPGQKVPDPAKPAADKPLAPRPPKLDALAAQTLARWTGLEHRAARNAIRAVEFDVAVTSKGGMTGTWTAKSRFRLDKRAAFAKAELEWADEEVARALDRRGWVAGTFANDYRDDEIAHQLAGATVTATKRGNGTILTCTGGRLPEDTYLIFDAAGVLIATMVGPLRKRFFYDTKDDKLVRSGESYELPDAKGEVTVRMGLVANYLVPLEVREVVRIRGQLLSDLTFTFSNHRFNGPAAAPAPGDGAGKDSKAAGKRDPKRDGAGKGPAARKG